MFVGLFGDNTAILTNARSLRELESKLNNDLIKISDWMTKYNLKFDARNSKALLISPSLTEKVTKVPLSLLN